MPQTFCRCCGEDMKRSDHCPSCFCEEFNESKECPDRDPEYWQRVYGETFSWDVYTVQS